MTVVAWPEGINIQSLRLNPVGQTASPGVGLDGIAQTIVVENRIWRGTVTLVPLTENQVATWTAFLDQVNGRAGVFALPVPNLFGFGADLTDAQFQALLGYTAAQIAAGEVAFDTGALWDGANGWDLPTFSAPEATAAAPVGASVLSVGGLGTALPVGSYLSVNGYLYRIWANAGGTLSITPPLREAIAEGATVGTGAPVIRVRLAEDDGGRVAHDLGFLMSDVSFDIVEVIGR